MTKPLPFALLSSAAVLMACWDTKDDALTPDIDARVATKPSRDDDRADPCPDRSSDGVAEADAAASGPQRARSAYERCEGFYRCGPALPEGWLRFDGTACLLGRDYVLHPDGGATNTATGAQGTWSGTYTNFDVKISVVLPADAVGEAVIGLSLFACERQAER